MNGCDWEEIRGFASPGEYQRFVGYIEELVSSGQAREIPVDLAYSSNQVYGGRWFANTNTGEIWRLVEPDFPRKGLWEPVAVVTQLDGIEDEYLKQTRQLLTDHPESLRNFEALWAAGKSREAYVLVMNETKRLGLVRSAENRKADADFFWLSMY